MANKKTQTFARFGGAVALVVGGLWAAGLTPLSAFGPAPATVAASAPQLKALSAKAGRRITTITIETSDPVGYLTSRPDPLTLLVDLRDVENAAGSRTALGAKGVLAGATVEEATTADGARVARVRIKLTEPAAHQVRSNRNLIYIDLDTAFPLGSAGAGPAAAAAAAIKPGRFATMLESVRGDAEPAGASVTLTGNGELAAEAVTPYGDGTARVVLDFPNVRTKTPADVFVGRGPVSVVHVATTGVVPSTRVVIDLLRPAIYRVVPPEDGQKDFKIYFDDERAQASAPGAKPAMVATLDPIEALLAAPRSAGGPLRASLAQQQQQQQPLQQQQQQGVPQMGAIPQLPPVPAPLGQGAQRFTGHPVTLDFQGADLRTVLRTFADISGLNIVIDQSVQGQVDVSLHEVPWDQALDIILKDHKLGYSVDGTIVRIAPITVLSDEEGQRRKLTDEQALSGELQVMTRPLSYAKAADLTALLTRTALSSRGDIQIDPRTNTIIIRDLASRLQSAAQLMDTLDRPQPQVEIEARIVTTTRDFARNLGVQWGFNGRVAADLGNTTGLSFPNQGSLTGRTGAISGPSATDAAASAVNLGVSPATSAIGLALGSVNGALNLDLALTALESSGSGRILSTPRVATQNNVAAEITQGVQIPIQTVANNTVTVTFRDAALKLNVTPQITAANTVIMQIILENSSPDFSRAINNIPPIDTQRAVTSILVSDGQTTVIGGIYVSNQQSTNDRTPGLHKLPLLGWLFKRQTMTDQSRELLIFITPRIIKI
jgi:type IV pilus secretin PilQ/predicted competence protein